MGKFDGSAAPNPGRMTIGGIIIDETLQETICTYSEFVGDGTNNEAEYLSLIRLLEESLKNGITKLHIKGDSLLVVNQINGKWKCKKQNLIELREQAKILLEKFDKWKLDHIYRDQNKEADSLTR